VSAAQVVLCFKLVRLGRDPKHLDSQVDVAGYAAVLREVSRRSGPRRLPLVPGARSGTHRAQ
jgi:hypothetical protein